MSRPPDVWQMGVELWTLAPVVVTQRLMGLVPDSRGMHSVRQRREMQRMVSEKVTAVQHGWAEMGVGVLLAFQTMWLRGWWSPLSPSEWPDPMKVAADALRPIHRTAAQNARRLGRKRVT